MKKYLLTLGLLLLTQMAGFGDAPATGGDSPPRVLQDPDTKVSYYLESDRVHIAAISPDGKLLWCRQVAPNNKVDTVISFGFCHYPNGAKGEDCISVVLHGPGYGGMNVILSKKDGVALSMIVD
jgi:hypothetical protein